MTSDLPDFNDVKNAAVTDKQRQDFLVALDDADVNLNSWEADFVGQNMDKSEFSEAQRTVIDSLMKRFWRV